MRSGPPTRREFLKGAGIAGIVAAGRAPAHAQGTTLHLLQWSHFIPAADTLFDAQAREFGKQAGAEVRIERINQNDLQARVTAAVQSGAGADIIIVANNHALLYEGALADVSDVAEEVGGKQGGWHDYARVNCLAGGRWVAVPQFIVSWAITYREDWLQAEGLRYPQTWDEFRATGKKMKAKGKPFGQAFGHSINDPNNWCYPLVWMWGGMEVESDGRRVILNRKATVDAVKFNNVLWKECFDEGGLAWDDSNNNRAFLSGEISLTGNAPSIYVAARREVPRRLQGDQPRPLPARTGRALLLAARLEQRRHEVRKEPETREGLHPLLHGPAQVRSVLRGDGYVRDTRHANLQGPSAVAEGSRRPPSSRKRSSTRARSATPARPAARRPRRCPSTSSSTCSPRASRAWPPKRPSSGPRAN